jgi:hypothetical protein
MSKVRKINGSLKDYEILVRRLLNGLKKQQNISSNMVEYIARYQIIYKRVIKAKKNSK